MALMKMLKCRRSAWPKRSRNWLAISAHPSLAQAGAVWLCRGLCQAGIPESRRQYHDRAALGMITKAERAEAAPRCHHF